MIADYFTKTAFTEIAEGDTKKKKKTSIWCNPTKVLFQPLFLEKLFRFSPRTFPLFFISSLHYTIWRRLSISNYWFWFLSYHRPSPFIQHTQTLNRSSFSRKKNTVANLNFCYKTEIVQKFSLHVVIKRRRKKVIIDEDASTILQRKERKADDQKKEKLGRY